MEPETTTPKTSRLSVAAFVLGLSGVIIPPVSFIAFTLAGPMTFPDGMAYIAIIILFVLFGFLASLSGVIFGIVAIIKIRRNRAILKGKGWAITGIVLGIIPLLLFIIGLLRVLTNA